MAESADAPAHWWIDVRGARLLVHAWRPSGTPQGAACVVHGLGEHALRLRPVAEAFAASGFAVVAPDLRGHGRSGGKRGHASSPGELVADLSAVIADASSRLGAMSWLLYGHSMGGALALRISAGAPTFLRACVASGPALRPAFPVPAWKMIAGRVLRRVAPSVTLYNEVNPEGFSHDPAVVEAWRADPLVHDQVSASLGLGLIELGGELVAGAAALRVPVLIVHGGQDPVTSAVASREFARRASRWCTLHIVPEAFHEVHHESSWPATWAVISGWLADPSFGSREK